MPPNSTGMIVAPTYPMLRDGPRKMLLDIARPAGILKTHNISTGTIVLHGNRTILLRSADNPDRLRGANLGWIWFDEAAMMHIDAWQIAIATLREMPGKAWITTTPRGRNWIYDLLHGSSNPDYAVIHSKTTDNVFLPDSFIHTLRTSYTSEQFEQEANGQFVDLSGALFKRQWFTLVDAPPPNLQWYRYWDLATSVRDSADYTASVRVAMADDGIMYIADGIRIKAEWPDVRKIMIDVMRSEADDTTQGVEEALHGLAGLQELRRMQELAHVTLVGYHVSKDKMHRAMPWAARAEQNMIRVVRGEWCQQFIDESVSFPYGTHDDMVDAVSGANAMLGDGSVMYDFM
jgi:predicted phage terminase large subunit-like protein